MTLPLGGSADTVQVAVVPDFSRFAGELRRNVDQAMREFATRVDATLTGVEQQITDAARSLGVDFQVGGEVAERAFRELETTAVRDLHTIEATTTAAAVGMGAKFQAAAAVAGAAVLGVGVAVGAGLGILTAMGLKSAATLEQTQIAFNALLGSAAEGSRVFKELQQFAAITPFQFTEITPVAQRFFTFADALGMTKGQVTDFLTVLGDLSSVTGSGAFGMERAALAMSQMAAKGRLSAQDVNQLADAFPGFNVRAAIAAQLGLTVAETMQRMENGTIDAHTGLVALLAGMRAFPGAAGAMEAQSRTLLGVWSTFKDVFSQALVAGFAPVIPGIKDTLAQITPILGEAIGALAPVLGGLLTALLKLAGPLVKVFSAFTTPVVEALGKAIDNIDPKMWVQLGLAMGQLAEALVPLIPLLVEFIVGGLEVAIPVLQLLALVLLALSPVFDLMSSSIHEFNRAMASIHWAEVGRAIGSFFTDLGGHIGDFFSDLFKGLTMLPEGAAAAFGGMVDIGAAKLTELVRFILGLPDRILGALAGLGDLLVDKGADLIRGLWRGISSLGGWLFDHVRDFITRNITKAITDLLGIGSPSKVMAEQVGRWIPAGIGVGVEAGIPDLRALLAGVGSQLPATLGAGAASSGASVLLGPGAVVVQFHGATPTAQQALDTGIKVGQGILDAINRRGVSTSVKQRT